MRSGAAALAFAAMLLALPAGAEDNDAGSQPARSPDLSDTPELGIRNGSFIGAPIPFQNPMLGAGLALGLGYIFQTDPTSDPSMLGIGAMRSDNGSRAAGLMVDLNLLENRWKISALYAQATLNYDLILPTLDLPLRQDGTLCQIELSYGVSPDLSFGGTLRYLDTSITTNTASLPTAFRPALNLEVLNVGAVADWDLRNDPIYPTDGARLFGAASRGVVLDGLVQDYIKLYLLFDHYLPLGTDAVLATRLALCGNSKTTPFYDQCSVGATDAFRGFNVTQLLDDRMASAQIEYRRRISKRLGVVAFAGAGAVGDRFGDLDKTGQATGLGLRYRVSQKFPVDFAIDGAHNSDDKTLLYISVGQRF